MSSELIRDICAEYAAAGCKTRVEYGGKHPRIYWTDPKGVERFRVCAGSSSDMRAVHNQLAEIRRDLRGVGLIGEPEPKQAERAIVELRDGRAICTSLDLAAHFNKAHKDVLRAIDRVRSETGAEFDRRNFTPISYTDAAGRTYRAYSLTRDGFSMVAMGFTGADAAAWKVRYIEAFNAMETQLLSVAANGPATEAIAKIRGDLEALTDIVLSLPSQRVAKRVVKRRPPVRLGPLKAREAHA